MLTKQEISDLIEELIIDNNNNLISAEDLRTVLLNMNDSELNLTTNSNLLVGLTEYSESETYSIGECVVYQDVIYQANIQTTIGTFQISEFTAIANYSNVEMSDYVLKQNAIELDDNKRVKTLANNFNFSTIAETSIYLVNSTDGNFGVSQTYPQSGKGLLEIFKRNSDNETFYRYTNQTDLTSFFLRKRSDGSWTQIISGETYTSSNGVTKIGNDFQIGGDFNVIQLEGNAFTVLASSILLEASAFIGNFDGISLLSNNNFEIGKPYTAQIKNDGDDLNVKGFNVNIQSTTVNLNGELKLDVAGKYTSDPYLYQMPEDYQIPTYKILKDTLLQFNNNIFENGLDSSSGTDGLHIKLGGTLTENTNLEIGSFNFKVTDFDNLGGNIVDFKNRQLFDNQGRNSINFTNRKLYDATESESIDYTIRKLTDSYSGKSLDWDTRELIGVDGSNSIANWFNGALQTSIVPTNLYDVVNKEYLDSSLTNKEDLIVKNPNATPLVWTSSNGVASFQPLPVLGAQIYYLTPTTSDVGSTFKQTLTPVSASSVLNFTGISASQLVTSFISDLGEPSMSVIPAGSYTSHLHIQKSSGNKTLQLYTEFWECSSSGTDIQLLAVAGATPVINTGTTIQEFIIAESTTQKNISVSSRIKTKLYATISGSGSSVNLSLYFGSEQDSNSALPATAISGANYLLLNGTQANLNMGSFNITTNNLITSTATANTVPYFNSSKELKSSSVTYTQLEYLNSLSSNVQTQLNSKLSGTGTTNTFPIFTGSNAIGNSLFSYQGVSSGYKFAESGTTAFMTIISAVNNTAMYFYRGATQDGFLNFTNGGATLKSNSSTLDLTGGGNQSNISLLISTVTYSTQLYHMFFCNDVLIGYFNSTSLLMNKDVDIQGTSKLYSAGGIVAGGSSLNAKAILQADSTDKGFLPPRMTLAQRSAITSVPIGLIVYQTDGTEGLYVYRNSGWTLLASAANNIRQVDVQLFNYALQQDVSYADAGTITTFINLNNQLTSATYQKFTYSAGVWSGGSVTNITFTAGVSTVSIAMAQYDFIRVVGVLAGANTQATLSIKTIIS